MLLRVAPDQTIDFILSLTNKAVESYLVSELSDHEVQEVKVWIDESTSITQHLSSRLWEMYRGTHVGPDLLVSIHMALEQWLVEYGKTAPKEDLEKRCLYLLEKSKSASITAIVVSILLAYPFKLFKVAAIIFKTKEFFFYDTTRSIKDQTQKSSLEMLKNS